MEHEAEACHLCPACADTLTQVRALFAALADNPMVSAMLAGNGATMPASNLGPFGG